ncbi:Rossmann-fold NAD(P)-binding domain-containing protein [Methylophaga thiooxydans]|uniref:Uncharacterized protein n=1 Tax=Methylophaga thiooxydans DMS010 TaxID=637616 RepID=C0N843_9GAMM|nr:NAD(P)H-binding protein [Methylophaga thiooxydans]EEF79044.1 hypothetical protein MDMS009_2304 [Methylophaga thiooxydans DMS010]
MLGSGWLGKPLAEHFMQQGYKVKLSTRNHAKQRQLAQSGFDSYIVDIDLPDPPEPDFLNTDSLIINITNKNGVSFERLISTLRKSPIKHVLFVSSSSVYQNLNRAVTEDEGVEDPDSALFQIENCFKNETAFETTIVRFSGLIGPNRHPGRFFRNGKQVQQADAPVNLIHLDDCIGIIDAIFEKSAWQQTFNGCADTHPTKREFYTHAASLADHPTPDFAPTQLPLFKIVSNTKAKHVLQYQFQYPDLMAIQDY